MLAELQNRLQALVASCPLLAGRPVLVEDKNNLVSQIETALQTQSLAVVVAPSRGNANAVQVRGQANFDEELEVVIHRGLIDADDVPSTVQVLDALVPLIHGAPLRPASPGSKTFVCKNHDLRENGDGSYVRVLVVGIPHPWGTA